MTVTYAGGVLRADNGATSAVDTTGWSDVRLLCTSDVSTPPSVSDNQGNSWVQDGSAGLISTGYGSGYLFAFKPSGTFAKSATHTFTISGGSYPTLFVVGTAGAIGSVSTFSVGGSTTEPFTSPNVSPGGNALLVAVVSADAYDNGGYTWGSSFTEQLENPDHSNWAGSVGTREVAAGTYSATATQDTTANYGAVGILAFTEAAAAAASMPPPRNQAQRIAPLLGF